MFCSHPRPPTKTPFSICGPVTSLCASPRPSDAVSGLSLPRSIWLLQAELPRRQNISQNALFRRRECLSKSGSLGQKLHEVRHRKSPNHHAVCHNHTKHSTPRETFDSTDSAFDIYQWRKDDAKANGPTSIQGTKRQPVSAAFVTDSHLKISDILGEPADKKLVRIISQLLADDDVVASLKTTTFLEILKWLELHNIALPFRPEYATRMPKHYSGLRWLIEDATETFQESRAALSNLCRRRIQHVKHFHAIEYAQMLRCARATYDGDIASLLMNMMLRENLKPDLASYNSFFAARCWSDAWHPLERNRLRVFPYTLRRRARARSVQTWDGHLLLPYRAGSHGLLNDLAKVFNHMVRSGEVADNETYVHLVTAFARERDMNGVKMILKCAWDIDVDAGRTNGVKDMPLDSPIRPDQSTLFVIAHAFGINNDVSTALNTVASVSERFAIPISQEVWGELLECSYVLSTSRHKNRKWDGAQLGQMPKRAPEDMWKISTSEPYGCKPTLHMYDIIIRCMRRMDRVLPMLDYVRSAMGSRLEESLQTGPGQDEADSSLPWDAIIPVYISRWFRLFLSGHRFLTSNSIPRQQFWQRICVPDIVDIFWPYREQGRVVYTIKTGFVELKEHGDGPPYPRTASLYS